MQHSLLKQRKKREGMVFPFLSLLLFFVFIVLSVMVGTGVFVQIDTRATQTIQSALPHTLDLPFSILSALATVEPTGFVWLLLFIILLMKRHMVTAASLFLFWVGSSIEIFNKFFLHQPDPPSSLYRGVFHVTSVSRFLHTNYAYPSGHIIRTTFLATFLFVWVLLQGSRRAKIIWGVCLSLFVLAMMVSRIYLAEHWLSDVLGGTLLGGSLALISAWTITRYLPSKR